MWRLQGVQLAEESEQQGRVNAALSAMVAATLAVALALPGVHENCAPAIAAIMVVCAVWAVVAMRFVPWQTAPSWVPHSTALGGLAMAGVGMWASAGHLTPGRFYLVIIVVATAYFFTPAEARLYPVLAFAVHASPLLYDAGARSGEFLTELIIVAPVYATLAVLIGDAKQHIVRLRADAHGQARQDPLTGLSNRRRLLEALEDVGAGTRASDVAGLLLLDLDEFKRANTLHGHAGGDHALRRTADVLRAATRRGDIPARLGGDEFAVLLHGVDDAAMAALSERVLRALRAADGDLGLPGFRLRGSIGWALAPADAAGGVALLAAADRALFAAKAAGKDAALPVAQLA